MARKSLDKLSQEIKGKHIDHQNLQEVTNAQHRLIVQRRKEWMANFNRLKSCLDHLLSVEAGDLSAPTGRYLQRQKHLKDLKYIIAYKN